MPLGLHPALGEGACVETHQRPRRDPDRKTVLPGRVQAAALPGAGQRVLRVARGAGREAAVFHSDGGDGSLFLCGTLVVLGRGRMGLLETCVIITTAAKEELADIHDRMPVIIAPEDYDEWLEAGGQDLLKPSAGEMEAYPVGSRVNNPRNQGEALIQPLG